MTNEIKKNQLMDEELDQVTGGSLLLAATAEQSTSSNTAIDLSETIATRTRPLL